MSLMAVPSVVLNLGCEMIYVLHQRLLAQGVAPDKGARVMREIVENLFDRHFLDGKVFIRQELFSLSSTRKLFDRLAHSSIMRLNESRCATHAAPHMLSPTPSPPPPRITKSLRARTTPHPHPLRTARAAWTSFSISCLWAPSISCWPARAWMTS